MSVLPTSALARRLLAPHRQRIIKIGRFLHAHPEVGFREHRAAQVLTDYLAGLGFRVTRPYAGLDTAFRAVLPGTGTGARVAVLAEYDALSGLGHACGHNLISTAALAAATVAAGCHRGKPRGTFEVIGTPAEESQGGKVEMVARGAFNHLDAAVMTHPAIQSKIGVGCLARKSFTATFRGRAAHAAGSPEQGVNALDAAILFFNGVHALRQHLREDARVHGIITHGGDAVNVIPERAEVRMGVRSLDEDYLLELCRRVETCCRSAARSMGARVRVSWEKRWYRAFRMNTPLDDVVHRSFEAVGIELRRGNGREGRGSLDMGNVSQVLPAAHPYFSIVPGDGAGVALHTREFMALANTAGAYQAALRAGCGLALAALRLLAEPATRRRVKRARG